MRQLHVLIRPSFQDWCQNRIFDEGTSYNALYRNAFRCWRDSAAQEGFRIDTWDCMPPEHADVMWFLDLPDTRREFDAIRRCLRSDCRLILQTLETPLIRLHAFHPFNQNLFDAVLRYDRQDGLPSGHFFYRLPNSLPDTFNRHLPFGDRKGLIVLNSNRIEGIWAIRREGLAGLPLIGKLLTGWKTPKSLLHEYMTAERYSYRRALARAAEHDYSNFVDIFGPGWNGEQISWCPLFPNRPYRCWRGKASGSKLEVCSQYRFVAAIENYQGNRGYISEKIFDAFFAGAVPVYLGDERITDVIPAESFVDVRQFRTPSQLLAHLRSMSEPDWIRMRDAGRAYVLSDGFKQFSDQQFVQAAMTTLRFTINKQLLLDRHGVVSA